MNKKDYIDAINEIKADDELKKKTIQKLTAPKKKSYTRIKRILSTAAVFVLLFSFAYMNNNVKHNEEINNSTVAKLPTVGSFENMKEMIEKSSKYRTNSIKKEMAVEDGILNEASIQNTTSAERKEYSTTNIQVQGVDEADIVKTNGDYIFYYREPKRAISIVNVKDEKVIKTIEYEDVRPIEMYLTNNRLVVITKKIIETTSKQRYVSYDYKDILKVIEYDISDIDNIKTEREIEIEGNLLTSRMIGDYVYIISNKYIFDYMLEDENMLKPIYRDTAVSEETKCVEYSQIQYFPDTEASSYMMISSFSVSDNDKPANIETYLGSGNNVYASTTNLYVTCRHYTTEQEFMGIEYGSYQDTTKVYKFALNNGEINYVADTTVPGQVNNQFSMDEYKGYFRIATTHNSKETLYKEVNNLYILDEKLNLVGQLENLAPGESIYSVRYMGEKAYVVTFKHVDPLFVIDLSNPTTPTVLGKLKIPGYSDYLHPYDETHIIGFGKDTETDGELVKAKGFKMALFDVSDVENPKELYSVNIGDSGTYSELLYNHKALLFSREKNIIAFPIIIREKQNNSKYYTKTTFKGAIIYGLSLENGFEERARISNDIENASIDRIIYIGNNLYTLSEDNVKVVDMNTMKEINKIEL